jgi:hypothetical protein
MISCAEPGGRSVVSGAKSGVYGEQLCAFVERGGYQQSKAHDPEPELELLFTQAETAW